MYSWTSAGSGEWSAASNWFDLTSGDVAIVAPGTADAAIIDGPGTGAITVTGPAGVLDLTVNGGVTLAGGFSIDALTLAFPLTVPGMAGTITSNIALTGTITSQSMTIGGFNEIPGELGEAAYAGIVSVNTGTTLSAASATLAMGDLQVIGGAITVSDGLSLGFIEPVFPLQTIVTGAGSLDLSDHASVQLGSLTMQDGELSLDATSTLEIGSSGTASAGIITVDPNAELRIGSFIPSDASINISDPVLNNGNIVDVGINLNNVTNNGTIQIEVATLGSISSAGQIDAFGGVTIGPSVTGTVDLSGSADTLDIALGAGATIDAADTPAIAGFGNASGTLIEDAIVLVGVSADNAHYVPIGPAIGTLTLDQGHTAVADLTLVGSYTSDEFTVVADSSGSTVTLNPPCFCEGTRILTRQGEIAVEDLRVGDLVITHPAGMRPICWLGQFGVSLARHPRPEQAAPIRIRRNAMAAGVPKRDLLVSPDHAVFLDGALIQAQALLNGASVTQEFPTRIEDLARRTRSSCRAAGGRSAGRELSRHGQPRSLRRRGRGATAACRFGGSECATGLAGAGLCATAA